MQDADIKVYESPGAPIYLVQRADSENYLIHREVTPEECETLDTDQVIEHDGKTFLYGILNLPNEEMAESVIASYFRAYNQLVSRFG